MTRDRYAQRPKAEPPDALISLRWDGRRKRWDATLTDRHGEVLATRVIDTTLELGWYEARELLVALALRFESMLPF